MEKQSEFRGGVGSIDKVEKKLSEAEQAAKHESRIAKLEESSPDYLTELRSRALDLIGEQDEAAMNRAIFDLYRNDLHSDIMADLEASRNSLDPKAMAVEAARTVEVEVFKALEQRLQLFSIIREELTLSPWSLKEHGFIELLTEQAESGDINSQFLLGSGMLSGTDHIPKEWISARQWLYKAASLADRDFKDYLTNESADDAQYLLGIMYAKGYGGIREPELSEKCLQNAARHTLANLGKTGSPGMNDSRLSDSRPLRPLLTFQALMVSLASLSKAFFAKSGETTSSDTSAITSDLSIVRLPIITGELNRKTRLSDASSNVKTKLKFPRLSLVY